MAWISVSSLDTQHSIPMSRGSVMNVKPTAPLALRETIAALKKAVKACVPQGGNSCKYCQMKAVYDVAWQAQESEELDSMAGYCADKLGRRQRSDTSIYHYLLEITGPRSPKTVSTWAKALIRARKLKVPPDRIFEWLDEKGVKARSKRQHIKPGRARSITKKRVGDKATPPWRVKTVTIKSTPTAKPRETVMLSRRPTGRSEG